MKSNLNGYLLMTDLDGTLLPSSKILSEKDIKAIARFRELGGKFSIATGRTFESARQYFDDLTPDLPIILCNGGVIYDCSQHKALWSKTLPPETRDIVSEVLTEFPEVCAEIDMENAIYAVHLNDHERYHMKISKSENIVRQCELDEIPDGWFKVLFAMPEDIIPKIVKFANDRKYSGADFVVSSKTYYEILPSNISKGSALELLRSEYGFDKYKVAAIGDYDNDLTMVKTADLGAAPSGAQEIVRKSADLVLRSSCEENAVAELIEYIIQNDNF